MPETISSRIDWPDPEVLEKTARTAATILNLLIKLRDRLSRRRSSKPSEKFATDRELQHVIDLMTTFVSAMHTYTEHTANSTTAFQTSVLNNLRETARAATTFSQRIQDHEARLKTLEGTRRLRRGKR